MEYKIAIVEDSPAERNQLLQMIERYTREHNIHFHLFTYADANSILTEQYTDFDAIFMDIQMPGLNGMEAARILRRQNPYVLLIFVTNLSQYAVDGYEVHAYDFILKPLNYENFSMRLERICRELAHRTDDAYLTFQIREKSWRLRILDILYVEVKGHNLIFHFTNDTFSVRGVMKNLEEQLAPHHFVRCNACYLVNLKYVRKFDKNVVLIGSEELRISQTRRQAFLTAFAQYTGGTV